MKWDAIAILLHVFLGLLDLYFRMEISMVQARYLVITPIAGLVLPHGDLDCAGCIYHGHTYHGHTYMAILIMAILTMATLTIQAVFDPTREELLFETSIHTSNPNNNPHPQPHLNPNPNPNSNLTCT